MHEDVMHAETVLANARHARSSCHARSSRQRRFGAKDEAHVFDLRKYEMRKALCAREESKFHLRDQK
eukprot:CAMPEP_0174834396 /NCGR_PEP_ID=MMETSP1114-20130205/4804_1 /TAXON_ID=312471 /ORGANISM="Neobodo designis, Strain CCAP 1951/1" /LENGTH=66 /DNA_ID=CAMNT_0016068303 /DNA_START=94 /DNA_END=291 /DNA_ORIENTATION=-